MNKDNKARALDLAKALEKVNRELTNMRLILRDAEEACIKPGEIQEEVFHLCDNLDELAEKAILLSFKQWQYVNSLKGDPKK